MNKCRSISSTRLSLQVHKYITWSQFYLFIYFYFQHSQLGQLPHSLFKCFFLDTMKSHRVISNTMQWNLILDLRDVCYKKNGKMWEFFPSPPSLGTPCLWKKIKVYFAFQDIRNIFGFHKNVHFFWVVLWFVEVGIGDPPSSENFPLYPVLFDFFTDWALGDPKQN